MKTFLSGIIALVLLAWAVSMAVNDSKKETSSFKPEPTATLFTIQGTQTPEELPWGYILVEKVSGTDGFRYSVFQSHRPTCVWEDMNAPANQGDVLYFTPNTCKDWSNDFGISWNTQESKAAGTDGFLYQVFVLITGQGYVEYTPQS